jgi:predicted amidohydrolase YtcJ
LDPSFAFSMSQLNPADLIVANARIYTGEGPDPWAEALASANGRILAVGTRQDVEPLGRGDARIFDAGGRTVFPGFVDAHVHLLFAYELGDWIDLTDHPSLSEVQRRVRSYAQNHLQEPVIVGYGFDYQALTDRGLPGRRDLDLAVSDRPVALHSWDGHTLWTNGRFADLAESRFRVLGHEVGDPVRDSATGELTGIFRLGFDLELPELVGLRSLDGLRRMLQMAARLGITTAFDVQVPLDALEGYETLLAREELPIHVQMAFYHPRGTQASAYSEFRAAADRLEGDRLRAGSVKLYIDGVQETYTACLLEPYLDRPESRGETVYPVEEFRRTVHDLDRAGFQILTHACGDGGVRIALDAYEALGTDPSPGGRRHRIEHCENIAPDDLDRFARLGVIPCMMPHHSAPELTRRWRQTMGETRWKAGFPWKGLLDRKARLAFSSDWPVADLNPFIHLKSAVARRDADGSPSPLRLSARQAIDAYTRGSAYATRCEHDRGTLAPGYRCDLIVLSEDPFAVPPDRLDKVRVLLTMVDGRVVYADSSAIDVGNLPAARPGR